MTSTNSGSGLRVWVLRHAKAASDGPGGDSTRPLTGRGRRQAESVCEHLADIGEYAPRTLPTLILCSPAVRARQTLELVLPAIPDAHVDYEKALYSEDATGVVDLIMEKDPGETQLMIVGHNPTLHELCVILAVQGESESLEAQGLPTAGLVELCQDGATNWKHLAPGSSRVVSRFVPDR
jgi:phosphohistidine phosphatase